MRLSGGPKPHQRNLVPLSERRLHCQLASDVSEAVVSWPASKSIAALGHPHPMKPGGAFHGNSPPGRIHESGLAPVGAGSTVSISYWIDHWPRKSPWIGKPCPAITSGSMKRPEKEPRSTRGSPALAAGAVTYAWKEPSPLSFMA